MRSVRENFHTIEKFKTAQSFSLRCESLQLQSMWQKMLGKFYLKFARARHSYQEKAILLQFVWKSLCYGKSAEETPNGAHGRKTIWMQGMLQVLWTIFKTETTPKNPFKNVTAKIVSQNDILESTISSTF